MTCWVCENQTAFSGRVGCVTLYFDYVRYTLFQFLGAVRRTVEAAGRGRVGGCRGEGSRGEGGRGGTPCESPGERMERSARGGGGRGTAEERLGGARGEAVSGRGRVRSAGAGRRLLQNLLCSLCVAR